MRGTEERASSVIPVEIYLGIIDYVSSSVDWYQDERRATLLNLALVCQFFYTATVPRLYDSLCFYGGPLREQNPGPINTVGFCRAIDNGRARATSLAYHVTECTLGWRGGGNRLDESLVAMFCGAFPQMSNLHTIILEFVTLYSPLLQTIDNLQSLRSLRLRDCGFADALINPQTELPEIFSTNEPIRTMSSLIYFVTQPTPRPSRVVSISTRAAHIDDRKRLPANHFNMALPLFPQGTAIVELRLEEMESTTTTWTIIASLNALQTLDIEHVVVPFDYTYPQELWASCLPHLQQLKISPSFTYIVVGRPISSLDLGSRESYSSPSSYFVRHNVSRQLPMSTFTNIMQSSADIVNLTIPVEFYLLEPLHKTFPALKTLCIMMQHHNFRCSSESFTDFINQVATKWPPAPSLNSLNLPGSYQPFDLESQRDYIPQLTLAFPNVNIIQFSDYVEWTKNPYEDKWTGYIPHKFHSIIASIFRRYPETDFKDVDGLLAPFSHLYI